MKHTILMSAFSCLPNRGSEPGIGWNWAVEAAKTQNVYVLTRSKCKSKIAKAIPKELEKSLHFIYCDSSSNLREKSIYLEYIHWQVKAYRKAKKICKDVKFDYVMHLTFGNVFLPTFMHKLDIPFIWGPLGGGEHVPYGFYSEFKPKYRISHIIKSILIKTSNINPFITRPAKASTLIIARTNDTKNIFKKKYHNKIDIKLETCIDCNNLITNKKVQTKYDEYLSLSFSGRLIPFKNVIAMIEAINLLKKYKIRMNIIGDGNQRQFIEEKIAEYSLEDKVRIYGELCREDTLEIVSNSDVFVFPSIRECGSWALMEAMALRKPIICLKKNGMEVVTNDLCAIRIDVDSQKKLIIELVEAIKKIYYDRSLITTMGYNSRKRIEDEFQWKSINEYIPLTLDRLDSKK